jgi:very-short-patch-repair endonuclease
MDSRSLAEHIPNEVFRTAVLSETERQFFGRLVDALPEYRVLPQVQISRFIEVRKVPKRQAILNRYARLSADFVLCDRDFNVKAVVELDDTSHGSPSQQARDAKKDAVVTAAGILMVRCHVAAVPTVARIREQLLKALAEPVQGNSDATNTDAQKPQNGTVRLGSH